MASSSTTPAATPSRGTPSPATACLPDGVPMPVNEDAAIPSGANLAKFWELQGLPALEWKGVWWGQHKGSFFRCLPFHRVVDLGPEEVRGFLRASSIRGLSFTSDRPGL